MNRTRVNTKSEMVPLPGTPSRMGGGILRGVFLHPLDLGRPGKSSRVRVCPQVLPVFLAEKPCGQPRPRL